MAETDFPVGWPRQRPDDLRYGMKARQRRRRFLAAPYSARQPARVSRGYDDSLLAPYQRPPEGRWDAGNAIRPLPRKGVK
jgi:hypothetical protein